MGTYYLGMDCGGTSTRMRLVDDAGTVLANAQSGASNVRLGADVVLEALNECLNDILSQSRLEREIYQDTLVCAGMAGLETADDITWLSDFLSKFSNFKCVSDAHTACIGALGGNDGAIIISGTGSIGYAVSGDNTYRVGGWGFELSDEYSGAWIGRRALQSALKSYDNLLDSTLADFILKQFDNNPAKIITWSENATPADYGQFFPVVMNHAKNGDEVAQSIMKDAGQGVSNMVMNILKRSETSSWVFLGGASDGLIDYLSPPASAMRSDTMGDPLDGAVIMARDLKQ